MLTVRSARAVRSSLWEPPQPLLKCPGCQETYRYDGIAANCVLCGYFGRAIVVEPAAPSVYPELPRRNRWRSSWLALRFEVFKRDGYRCQLCGNSAATGARLEADHKLPKARGGKDTMDNVWTLCYECNRGKSDELL